MPTRGAVLRIDCRERSGPRAYARHGNTLFMALRTGKAHMGLPYAFGCASLAKTLHYPYGTAQ